MKFFILMLLLFFTEETFASQDSPEEFIGELHIVVTDLPEIIELPFGNDPLSKLILSQTQAGLLKKTVNGLDLELARGIQTEDNFRIWNISLESKALAHHVLGTLNFYKKLSDSRKNIPSHTLEFDKIKLIEVVPGKPKIDLRFTLVEGDSAFGEKILTLPILNNQLILLREDLIGRGTFIPLLGNVQIEENLPGKKIVLIRNTTVTQRLIFEKLAIDTEPLNLLRSGRIDGIFLPSQAIRSEAKDDPTLKFIQVGPTGMINEGILENHSTMIFPSLIVRKSLVFDEVKGSLNFWNVHYSKKSIQFDE